MTLIFYHSRRALCSLFFLVSCCLLFHASISTADALIFKPIRSNCTGDSIAENSTVWTNLNSLLSSLRSKSLLSNSDDDSTGNHPNRAYGFFLCQGDLSHNDCQLCIRSIITHVSQSCSTSRRGTTWNKYCQLRYSDRNISGIVDAINMRDPCEKSNSAEPMVLVPDLVIVGRHRRSLVAPQPTAANEGGGEKKKSSPAAMPIMASILVVVTFCSFLYCLYCWRWRKRNDIRKAQINSFKSLPSSDLPLMDLCTIQKATNNFSKANKLGEGGFGPVYRGVLCGGREVAVKRLSTKSKQGSVEFKNEVELIAKLQHRNLVRILGFCIEREENLLIYEFLPNKSLDAFLFDPSKRRQLDWSRRHHIIVGIARGLLYLHEDSLLKVIHRDLKASNVLLDNSMNPKISDFGMAKIFEEECEVNTGSVVGTFGYMAPEYAMEGVFSVKSDVFSYGVLLLEILSGRRNSGSHLQQFGQTLLSHAWQLWSEDKANEFMDPLLGDSYPMTEAWRCLHVGMLCIQENPEYRPTMSSVVVMLGSEQMPLSPPTEPPSSITSRESDVLCSTAGTSTTKTHSINEVTITCIEPR